MNQGVLLRLSKFLVDRGTLKPDPGRTHLQVVFSTHPKQRPSHQTHTFGSISTIDRSPGKF